ncbi:MAG: hypothetical protein IJW82_05130 [Clostridia bacterium]|nr:hypothetical protein [Clostridia bacterium]
MKKYKEKKTGRVWVAICKDHIDYFNNNPNFTEIKSEVKKNNKIEKNEVEENSTENK